MEDDDILIHLENAGSMGYTWKELQSVVHRHHGSISGALSNLHGQQLIYRTKRKRKDCAVYIHAMYKSDISKELIVEKPRTSKANQLLNKIVEAFDAGADIAPFIAEAKELVI